MTDALSVKADDTPFCGNCGYDLSGSTESSKCPECGRPIVEVLTRKTFVRKHWIRYTSKATLLGWPVIDIALSGNRGGKPTIAKGIVAIGNFAVGGIALGAITVGIVDLGAIGIGVWSIGALAVGLLGSIGSLCVGLFVAGNVSIGVFASGLVAVGVFAQGQVTSGYNTRSFSHFARGVPVAACSTGGSFSPMRWYFGNQLNAMAIVQPFIILVSCSLVTAGVIGFVAWRACLKNPGKR